MCGDSRMDILARNGCNQMGIAARPPLLHAPNLQPSSSAMLGICKHFSSVVLLFRNLRLVLHDIFE